MTVSIGTITHKSPKVYQANFLIFTTIDLDNSYPTGGYDLSTVLDAADKLPNYEILHVEALADGTYFYDWDAVNTKLVAFDAGTGAEVGNGTDLSGVTGLQLTIWAQ